MKGYEPSGEVLRRYADVLVNFALNRGRGVKKGDVVLISGAESAKPLLREVRAALWRAGAHTLMDYHFDGEDRYGYTPDFFSRASNAQLDFFPAKYFRGLVDEIDHVLFILGSTNPRALRDIDPKKIMRRGVALKPYLAWRQEKEHRDKLSWTLALWGTPQMAKEAGLTHEAYWREIINACFLDEKNPIAKWREVYREIHAFNRKLNALSPNIEKLHLEGSDANLWITLGRKRNWLSGRGANIPSFEIFTSPDWRGTEGWIRFSEPLYRHGNRVEGIELVFKNGRVVNAKAKKGEAFLKAMVKTPGADKIGEFSLTDSRHSRIRKFMAETLFDENMGGPQGNTHIALGSAYADTYAGDVSALTARQKAALGYNDSSVHTDMVSTTKRRVTAHFKNGGTKIIYDNGQFTL